MKFGVQLYTLREMAEREGAEAVLKAVSEAGYDGVEFAGFYGKKRKNDADRYIYGQQNGGKYGVYGKGESKVCGGKNYNGKNRAYGVGKEKLHRFDVGYGDIHNITFFPVDKTGRGKAAYYIEKRNSHVSQKTVCTCVRDIAFDITAGYY